MLIVTEVLLNVTTGWVGGIGLEIGRQGAEHGTVPPPIANEFICWP